MFTKSIPADEAMRIIKEYYEKRHRAYYTRSMDSKGNTIVIFNSTAPIGTVVGIRTHKGSEVWRMATMESPERKKTKQTKLITTASNIDAHKKQVNELRLEIADMFKNNADRKVRKESVCLVERLEASISRYEKKCIKERRTMGEKDAHLRYQYAENVQILSDNPSQTQTTTNDIHSRALVVYTGPLKNGNILANCCIDGMLYDVKDSDGQDVDRKDDHAIHKHNIDQEVNHKNDMESNDADSESSHSDNDVRTPCKRKIHPYSHHHDKLHAKKKRYVVEDDTSDDGDDTEIE